MRILGFSKVDWQSSENYTPKLLNPTFTTIRLPRLDKDYKFQEQVKVIAKYDSLRKIERNEALRDYAKRHPDLSQKEIGMVFGISTSRVSKLLSEVRRKK